MVSNIRSAALILLLTACGNGTQSFPEDSSLPAETALAETVAVRDTAGTMSTEPQRPGPDLVDPAIPPAIAGEGGWNYELAHDADLDGDGDAERVVLTAQVEMYRGRPAWDDGQPWQVYVEDADGSRTYLYAQRLQLGTLAMRVTRPEGGRPAAVVLLEHLPDRLSVYEAFYAGPGQSNLAVAFQRSLDPRGETASPSLP